MVNDTTTYEYYYSLTFTYPIILLLGLLFLGIITLLSTWIYACTSHSIQKKLKPTCKTSPSSQTEKLKPTCKTRVVQIVRLVLRDLVLRVNRFLLFELEIDIEREDTKQAPVKYYYYIYGAQVRFFVLQTTFILFVTIILVSVVLLWTTFLTDIVLDCDSTYRYDCYLRNETHIPSGPIEDCDDYINEEVICFRFVYKFSEGLGEAGGFLFVMQVLMNAVIYVTVRFKIIAKQCCSEIGAGVCTVGVIGPVLMIFIGGLPIALITNNLVFQDSILDNPQRTLQFCAYFYVGWTMLFMIVGVTTGTYNLKRNKFDVGIDILP